MVLQPGGCGRVSYRRHKTINTQLNTQKREGKQPLRLLPFLLFRFLLLNQHQPATTIGTTFPFALSLANLHSNHPTRPQRPVTAASMVRTQLCSPHELSQATAMFIVAALESNQGLPFSLSLCLKQCGLDIGSCADEELGSAFEPSRSVGSTRFYGFDGSNAGPVRF